MRYLQVFVLVRNVIFLLYIANGKSKAAVESSPSLQNGEECPEPELPLKCSMDWNHFQVPVPLPFHCSSSDLLSRCLDFSTNSLHTVKKVYVDGKAQYDGKTLSSMSCSSSIVSGRNFTFELNSVENIYAVALKVFNQQGNATDFDVGVALNKSSDMLERKRCQYKTISNNWIVYFCLTQENVHTIRIEFQELGFFGNSVFVSHSQNVDFCSVLFIPYPIKPCGPPGHYEEMTDFSPRRNVYFAGESVSHSCRDPKQEIIGTPFRTCLNSGQWRGKPPLCTSVAVFTPESFSLDLDGENRLDYNYHRAISINNQRNIYFFLPAKLLVLGIRFLFNMDDQDQRQNMNVSFGGIQFNRKWPMKQCVSGSYCLAEYFSDPPFRNIDFALKFEIQFKNNSSGEITNVQVFGFQQGNGSFLTNATSYNSTTLSFHLEKPKLIFFVGFWASQYDHSQISKVWTREFELVHKSQSCDGRGNCSAWFSTLWGNVAFGSSVEIQFESRYPQHLRQIEIYGLDNGGRNCPLRDTAAFTEEDSSNCLPGFNSNSNTVCSRKFCPLPTPIENGHWKYTNDLFTVNNYSIEYKCFEGFQLQGEKMSTCADGRWSWNAPICKEVFCPEPGNISNGHYRNISGPFRFGRVVQLICDQGFVLFDNPDMTTLNLTCRGNGTWFPENPEWQHFSVTSVVNLILGSMLLISILTGNIYLASKSRRVVYGEMLEEPILSNQLELVDLPVFYENLANQLTQ